MTNQPPLHLNRQVYFQWNATNPHLSFNTNFEAMQVRHNAAEDKNKNQSVHKLGQVNNNKLVRHLIFYSVKAEREC